MTDHPIKLDPNPHGSYLGNGAVRFYFEDKNGERVLIAENTVTSSDIPVNITWKEIN